MTVKVVKKYTWKTSPQEYVKNDLSFANITMCV